MIEPIRLEFEVRCSAAHAFETWTSRIDTWWPRDHTVTNRPGLSVVLEPWTGGRLFERTADGGEHDWGSVTAWDPPTLLAYTWHLSRTPGEATSVLIRFRALSDDRTRVQIEHSGWERLGAQGVTWRDRNGAGWSTLLPHYRRASEVR